MEKPHISRLFTPADILLPKDCDMTKWSVIACDQHTSEPEYWQRVDGMVDGAPSTLRMMLPEYLYTSPDLQKRIDGNVATMRKYRAEGLFRTVENSFIYVERRLFNDKVRRGLVGKLDLEQFDYGADSDMPVRATEGVVREKIPVRIKLRRGSTIDMPHVLMLADDPNKTLIEPFTAKKDSLEKLYDFPLMEGGGHIAGYRVCGKDAESVTAAIIGLDHNRGDRPPIVLAAGDGNHSIAAAKACWEILKPTLTETEQENHPARYALVEVVNIRDEVMAFESINRVVFDTEPEKLLFRMLSFFPRSFIGIGEGHKICYIVGRKAGVITVPYDEGAIAIGALTRFLDEYLATESGRIDFVHGDDAVIRLAQQPGAVGFILPAIDKATLFDSVSRDGVLPRKTFSMGGARDKRYYLECRDI